MLSARTALPKADNSFEISVISRYLKIEEVQEPIKAMFITSKMNTKKCSLNKVWSKIYLKIIRESLNVPNL